MAGQAPDLLKMSILGLRDALHGLNTAISARLQSIMQEDTLEREKLLEIVDPQYVSHRQLILARRLDLSFERALSFNRMMVENYETRQLLRERFPEWLLDPKPAGFAFADAIGLRRPIWDGKVHKFDKLPVAENRVIKPVLSTGSRGVYIINPDGSCVHLQDDKHFTDWAEASAHARMWMSKASGNAISDKWTIEELIPHIPQVSC